MNRLAVLALTLGASSSLAANTPLDVDRAANTAALALDSVIQQCPANVVRALPSSRCIPSDADVTATRRLLSASTLNLYGAWRSDNNPKILYNWVMTSTGYVNIGVTPDPAHPGATLVIVSLPAVQQTSTQQISGAPAFRRPLQLSTPRMNGEDVRALQNRLMDVSKTARGKGGDGWYGPVTEANVKVFQSANGLRSSGVVDQLTWNRLFSSSARFFDAHAAQQLVTPGK
ncbi:peptidoglycan-binding domain-containing protein [Deinococcus ruber]|uniref:Peptidoglycan binding-like domain-containing protein n=1 Tax=Deinococcus ruber TaxID=1848197 RepID=A0A918C3Y6_9DEIO|nr:peptidoglycan-binding protein [Deinococcus ruber]GGR05412.1 hypothetical protein GCM10008957_17940 [Deinococcus ruber]